LTFSIAIIENNNRKKWQNDLSFFFFCYDMDNMEELHFTADQPAPFTTMGWFTFLRTYARRHNENDPNSTVESWPECLNRIINSCNTQLNVGFTKEEAKEVFDLLYNLKCSVAGRFMWQLGTRTVGKLGLPSLQNCAALVVDEPVRPFTWTMNFLMLGAGVGYRILPEDVEKLPVVKEAKIIRQDDKDADFIVPDSREGWVKLLAKVLKAHFYSGRGFTYSCMLLRSKGAPIKGFGGLASGPESLCSGMDKISNVLNKRAGQKIRPVDALDIMNIIGELVVSGNVRRCLPAGSLVHTKNGLCPIESIKVGMEVFTTMGYKPVVNVFDQGVQNIVRIRTNTGWFDCTKNHRMAINVHGKKVWTTASELRKGDIMWTTLDPVPVQSSIQTWPKHPDDVHPPTLKGKTQDKLNSIAWFLGVLHATWMNSGTFLCYLSYPTREDDSFLGRLEQHWNKWGSTTELVGDMDECRAVLAHNQAVKAYLSEILDTPHPSIVWANTVSFRLNYLLGVYQACNNCVKRADYARSLATLYLSCGRFARIRTSQHPDRYYLETPCKPERSVVEEITFAGPCHTYDIEVSEAHEFFCHGYLTHNSAQIALGDCKDKLYLQAKRWDLGNIPNWRAFSNNSVICNDINEIIDNEQFWDGYRGNGEPYGLINIKLHQSCGRLGETQYPDPDVVAVNPCSEQSLCDMETCCLAELYLPNISDKNELYKCARYMYRICKHSLTLPCVDSSETEAIVHKNMRMGIGVTGYLQATEEQRSWLKDCYTMLREYDAMYSAEKGWPRSIKLTTVKPAGTLSLLGNCTPGVHPGYARYYIRRIRVAAESALVALARRHNYPVEYVVRFDGTNDHSTVVVSFPCSLPNNAVLACNCTAVDQLEWVKKIQTEWSDNSVSVTVYYRKEELPAIKSWLKENYNNSIKSVSFLLHSDHGFKQAPLEEITKEQYEQLSAQCQPIRDFTGVCYTEENPDLIRQLECSGGVCPLK
jgi:ribonucleotide reductase alpha subunit